MLALRTLLLSLVLVVLAAPGAHARPAPQTVVQDDALFLHGTEQEIRAGLEQAREVGIERVRLTAGWSVIAPSRRGRRCPRVTSPIPRAIPAITGTTWTARCV